MIPIKYKFIREQFIFLHILLIVLIYIGTRIFNVLQQDRYAILVSGLFIGVYFMVFIWSMKSIIKKQALWLAAIVLLSKFFVLTAFVVYCVSNKSFTFMGLIIGLSTAIPSIVIWSFLNKKGFNLGTF